MANERYLALGAGLAALLCILMLVVGRTVPDRFASATSEALLERARRAGHAVMLTARFDDTERLGHEVSPEGLVPEDETTTQLVVSKSEVVIRPSKRDALLLHGDAQKHLRDRWVRPFLKFGDYDGAVRGFARGYLEVLEQAREVSTVPRPPPILGPNVEAMTPTTYTTWHWGVPFGVAVSLAGIWLLRIAARHSMVR